MSIRATVRMRATVRTPDAEERWQVHNLSRRGVLLRGSHGLETDAAVDIELEVEGADALQVTGRVIESQFVGERQATVRIAFDTPDDLTDGRLGEIVTRAYRSLGGKVAGQLRAELARQGITDVSKVADALHAIKQEQAQAHLFSADMYTRRGSDATAQVVSGTTGESRDCIVWSLNLYLGLNRNERVIEKTREAVSRYGTGCGTSAASGGLNELHHEIETRVAEMVGMEQALVFPTGYSANLAALSALPGPKDLVLMDRECHASMFDGVRLSGRKYMAFGHNDVEDLARRLERFGPNHENIFVVVESAYSMSGDLAPLREIAALKDRYNFFLYVDEAHTFGFYGEGGRGYCHEVGVADRVDFIMSTFSKATASIGGFVAGAAKYCTLMQAVATPYIFQACLSPPDAATILAALDEIQNDPSHAQSLHDKNRSMRDQLIAAGFDLGTSQSPVIPVYVPDLEKLYRLCAELYLDGIYSVPVVYPAVGPNEGRIRFIVNAHHTSEQIERTVNVLAQHAHTLGLIQDAANATA